MSENDIETYKQKIAELEKQLKEAKTTNNFDELKTKYEKVIEEKNLEIKELNKTVEATRKKVDETVDNLNDEVTEKLEQSRKLEEMNKQIEELMVDKAETTVDNYIQKGIITPAQRDTAVKLCLSDNDTFVELYKDAQPIIDLSDKPKTRRVNDDLVNGLKDYFKQ